MRNFKAKFSNLEIDVVDLNKEMLKQGRKRIKKGKERKERLGRVLHLKYKFLYKTLL